MTGSIIEQTRLLHQDLEKHLQHMVNDLCEENKLVKDRILQEHRVKMRLEKMRKVGQQLMDLYEDEGGPRKQELEQITGEEVFPRFYEKLKDIRDYYRKFPDVTIKDPDYELKPRVKFAGSEVGGMFVDLHPLYEKYVNMGMFKRCDYLSYLLKFDKFHGEFPQKVKFYPAHFQAYKTYLEELCDYLSNFQLRTNPLVDVNELFSMIDQEFEQLWAVGTVPGWTDADAKESVSDDGLQREHANDPLFCKSCSKLFTKSSTFTNHLVGRKHRKAVEDEGQEKQRDPRSVVLARLEFRIKSLSDLQREVIDATRDHVLKKQTRTYEEIAADLEEQQEEVALSDSEPEEEEAAPYNPLNLPLGWDGKPIPYWLYKLHGLNIEYRCDICGGFTYRGPRAYERHFSEWRHTYGLRCLGITNSKDYMHITKFEDAIALHERLQARDSTSGWKPEEEEEYEDEEGNVFNKKTYDELKRQGVI